VRKDYLERLRTVLINLKDGFNYNQWYPIINVVTSDSRWTAIARYQTDPVAARNECGTGACVGGWTIVTFMTELGIEPSQVEAEGVECTAKKILELRWPEVRFLFHPHRGSYWINNVMDAHDDPKGAVAKCLVRLHTEDYVRMVERDEAIARIDHLLANGSPDGYFDKYSPMEQLWVDSAEEAEQDPGGRFNHYDDD